jgi:hypothetical protein
MVIETHGQIHIMIHLAGIYPSWYSHMHSIPIALVIARKSGSLSQFSVVADGVLSPT